MPIDFFLKADIIFQIIIVAQHAQSNNYRYNNNNSVGGLLK